MDNLALPKPKSKRTLNSLLLKIDKDDLNGVQSVFLKYDMSKYMSQLLRYTADHGIEKCGLWLLDHAKKEDIDLNPRLSFFMASGGSVPLLQRYMRLKPRFSWNDIKGLGGSHLIGAATGGKVEMIEFVLEKASPKNITQEQKNLALSWASHNGHFKAVEILSSVGDPLTDNSLPLQWAFKGGHRDIIDFLVPMSNLSEALYDMHKKWKTDMAVIREIKAYEERRIINQALQENNNFEEDTNTPKKLARKM